jgi:hypothetical protein
MLISLTDYVTRQQILVNTDLIRSARSRDNYTSIKMVDDIHPIEVDESPSVILNKICEGSNENKTY